MKTKITLQTGAYKEAPPISKKSTGAAGSVSTRSRMAMIVPLLVFTSMHSYGDPYANMRAQSEAFRQQMAESARISRENSQRMQAENQARLDQMAADRRAQAAAAQQRAAESLERSRIAAQQQLAGWENTNASVARAVQETTQVLQNNRDAALARWQATQAQREAVEEQRINSQLEHAAAAAEADPQASNRVIETVEALPGERYSVTRFSALSASDVENMSYSELRYAINEMYARYGLIFKDKDIDKRFRSCSWYQPVKSLSVAQIESAFSEIEAYNVKILGHYRDIKKP